MLFTVKKQGRYLELDIARAVAVIGMVVYHFLFDLYFLYGVDLPVVTPAGRFIARSIAVTFLILVGISFVITWQKTPAQQRIWRVLKRTILISAAAAAVSVFTWLIVPEYFVRFGILHLIAVSSLLQPVFAPLKRYNILPAIVILLIGFQIMSADLPWWVYPLGGTGRSFPAVDYYTVLPWFGFVLLGMTIGSIWYTPARSLRLSVFENIKAPSWLLWTGQHALLVYMVHQPLILLGLYFAFQA